MRRFALIDWLLIGTFLPLAIFGVVMTIVHGVRGDFVRLPWPHDGWLRAAPDSESYPTVRRVDRSADGLIAEGDRLIAMEGEDLRGETLAGYLIREGRAVRGGARSILFTIERGGVRSDARVALAACYRSRGVPWWATLPFVVTAIGTAFLLLLRVSSPHLARRIYLALLLFGFWLTPYFWVPTVPWGLFVSSVLGLPAACVLVLWILCEFIPGVHLWGRWQKGAAAALALALMSTWVALYCLHDVWASDVAMRLSELPTIGFVVAWLIALTQGYRRADPLGRRQIKWVVLGFYAGTLPIVVAGLAPKLNSSLLDWRPTLMAIGLGALLAIPLGLLTSIVFYRFLDIDRLFSATLSYSVLAVFGITLVLGVMPMASRVASNMLGVDPGSGQLLLAFGLAAVFVPAQRVLRPQIDRVLFPERIAITQGFETLLGAISSAQTVADLVQTVAEGLDSLFRPVSAILYVRNDDAFTPLLVRGRTASPAFALQSPLIHALEERATPLTAERWSRQREASLTPFERAALETVDMAILLPIRRGLDLVAFTCLGPKRSGDIYTSTDLALLGAVAGRISDRVVSIDAVAVAEQARAMQAALRRYVPGAVAQRVVGGKEVAAEEREVTVLFVDIRGYTGLSEQREVEEIFHTVNRYTEEVSRRVQANGGAVVEFHGDGMLAVFGAPDDLPAKERAAVQAALDVLVGIDTLPPSDAIQGSKLSVGVGIATGPSFVGNIQSADRLIWTVIGNTVNLAARLQALTRDLEASVAIDDLTFVRAGEICRNFVRHAEMPIRGRSRAVTLHTLPIA